MKRETREEKDEKLPWLSTSCRRYEEKKKKGRTREESGVPCWSHHEQRSLTETRLSPSPAHPSHLLLAPG